MRGVCLFFLLVSRTSSRLSPRFRHSSTSAAVVAVNRLRELDDEEEELEAWEEEDDQLPPILFALFCFVFCFFHPKLWKRTKQDQQTRSKIKEGGKEWKMDVFNSQGFWGWRERFLEVQRQ
jgi:hypothetical protein